jgi:cytochrome d ubiquinol oxidase subunit I
MLTPAGVSYGVGAGTVLFSLLAFTLIYAALMGVDIYLLAKYTRRGVGAEAEPESSSEEASSPLVMAS